MTLKYVNSLGESSWEDKKKHLGEIRFKYIFIIRDLLKRNKEESEKNLNEHLKNKHEVSEENLKVFNMALDDMERDIEYQKHLIEAIQSPDLLLTERDAQVIFIELCREDDEFFRKEFKEPLQSEDYYQELREATAMFSLVSGIPEVKGEN